MASLAAGNEVGDALTVLWTDGSETRIGFGVVVAEVPFSVELEDQPWPEATSEVKLVRDQGDRWVAGSATVAMADEGLLMLRGVQWEEPSMRVHDRTEVEWPTTIRILDDHGAHETYQIGMTTDISLGGAAVYLDEAPEVGSLVEVKAHPQGTTPMRAVGVVVRRTGYNVGLAFLYLWGAGFLGTDTPQYELRRAA